MTGVVLRSSLLGRPLPDPNPRSRWAASGFCPAAGIAALPGLNGKTMVAAVSMAAGIVMMRTLQRALAPAAPPVEADM